MAGVWVAAGATAIVLYGLNSVVMGPAWVADWFDLVMAFSGFDVQFNFVALVSWQGMAQALFGDGNRFAVVLGWSFSVATIVALSWVWFRGGREADFSAQLGLASVAIVLISPHTLFYDGGIALIAVVALLHRLGRLNASLILVIWAGAFLQLISPQVGVSLSFLPLILILILAIMYLWPQAVKRVEAQAA